jgi:ankyrin repeat protein
MVVVSRRKPIPAVIDKEGWSPLHCAAQERHLKAVITLLNNVLTYYFPSTCFIAFAPLSREFDPVTLAQGINPNIHNSEGTTALHYLARNKVTGSLSLACCVCVCICICV